MKKKGKADSALFFMKRVRFYTHIKKVRRLRTIVFVRELSRVASGGGMGGVESRSSARLVKRWLEKKGGEAPPPLFFFSPYISR